MYHIMYKIQTLVLKELPSPDYTYIRNAHNLMRLEETESNPHTFAYFMYLDTDTHAYGRIGPDDRPIVQCQRS